VGVWPPAGIHREVTFSPPGSYKHQVLRVVVNYELFDNLPTLRKWVSVVASVLGSDVRCANLMCDEASH